MPSLQVLRLVGVAVLAAVLFTSGVLALRHYDGLKADRVGYRACKAFAEDPARLEAKTGCAPALAAAIADAAAARACDAGLLAGAAGGYAVQRTCSAPVKRRDAEALTLQAELADRDRQLDQVTKDRDRDVARAEARGVAQTQRETNARAALEAAPRGADGRIVCRADCLRVLAGDAAGAARR